MIAPPDGDMAAYMASLEKLMGRTDQIYYPAHGEPIEQPLRRVVIHRFQPANRAAAARMLHDDGHLAQPFEGPMRREQL